MISHPFFWNNDAFHNLFCDKDVFNIIYLIFKAGLETILLPLRTGTKFSSPRGVRIDREVLPLFTGTHDEQTMARKDIRASHLLDKTKWMHNLGVCSTPQGHIGKQD